MPASTLLRPAPIQNDVLTAARFAPPHAEWFRDLRNRVNDITTAAGQLFPVTDPAFGAKGDGSTDDTDAFQLAYDAAEEVGGVVYVPPTAESYILEGPVTAFSTTRQVSMLGAGYASHIQLVDNAAGFTFSSTSVLEPAGGSVRGIHLSGSASATAASALFLNGSKGFRVEDSWIESVGQGIKIDNAADISLSRLLLMDLTPGTGVGLKLVLVNGLWMSDIAHTIGNVLGQEDPNGAPDGFCLMNESAGTSVVRVFGTNIYVRHAGYAFKFAPTGVASRVDTVYITNLYADACNEDAIQCATDADSLVLNVTFHHGLIGDATVAATGVSSNGASVNGQNCRGIKFRHLLFGAIDLHGVVIGSNTTTGDYVEVDSCSFGSIGLLTPNTYDCVNVQPNANGFIVRDSVLRRDGSEDGVSHRYGVNVEAGTSDRYQIVNNVATGMTGGVFDGGSGVNKIVAQQEYGSTVFGVAGPVNATSYHLTDGITAPGATVGRAKLYVDTADGDLKVVFGDGVVKTIATDT